MKFNKLLTKTLAAAAMSTMLFSAVVSASTIKAPNMGGVSTQYAAMVQAANQFDDKLGNLIVNAFANACYTTAAIDNAIANTNNAIVAINNITLVGANNSATSADEYMRDVAGSVTTAVNYLNAAGLTNAVSFNLEKTDFKPNSSSEYYKHLKFSVITRLYTANEPIELITLTDSKAKLNTENRDKIITQLKRYITLLNAVKTFDTSAGCYDTTNTTQAPSNTTQAPSNTTSKPSSANARITAKNKTIKVGDTFRFMDGVTAKDGNGTDITKKVTVSGKVNTAIPGKYSIKYSVKGSNGVVVTKTTTVTVK